MFILFIVFVAIFLALYYILIGGLNMITSRGHKESIASNRDAIYYAILGLVFVFLSFFIMNVLGKVYGLDLFSFLFKSY
jgi:predicted small integral membrane protein